MPPLISIIVPCYNVQDFLPETINSIVHQTYPNWELILVDDGSTDNTLNICKKYALTDNRIRVIHKTNGGLVSARNAGQQLVNGNWQMYLDGDDWIDTNTLEKLTAYIKKFPDVDILFWKCIQELGNQSIIGKWEWKCTDKERLYINEECKELARHTLIYKSGIATAYCKLLRSKYVNQYNVIHDNRLRQGAEGLEFSLRAFYFAQKALYVNEYFNHYRYNENSISKQVNEANTVYLTNCFNVIEENIASYVNSDLFYQALYQRVIYALIAIAMSTYFHPANKDKLTLKIKKYNQVIEGNSLYKRSVKEASTKGMDKMRKATLFFIRTKMYFMLQIISKLKQYYLKKGKFNY